MAMIKCTECGKEISDRAKACPHCGCPKVYFNKTSNIKKRSYLKRGILVWFLIPVELIVVLVAAVAMESDFAGKIAEALAWSSLFLNIVLATVLAVKCGRDINRSANIGEKISAKNIIAMLLAYVFVAVNTSFAYRAFEGRVGVNLGGANTVCLLLWVLCGIFCYFLTKEKGYPKNMCWAHCIGGLLMGVIWLLVVLCKKPYSDSVDNDLNRRLNKIVNDLRAHIQTIFERGVLDKEQYGGDSTLAEKNNTAALHMHIDAATTDGEPKVNKYIGKKIPQKHAVAAIAVVVLVAIVASMTSSLGADGKIALQDCETLQSMCKVPSSFEVYEAVVYHGESAGTCTYITYGAENSYGAKLKSVAVFADGRYLGNYDDEREDFGSLDEYDRFVLARAQYKFYLLYGSDKEYADKCGMNFIDTGKLMKKLKRYN